MIVIVKNAGADTAVWSGQEFTPGFEYTLQTVDFASFPSSASLMAAVSTGVAVISDGTSWLTPTEGWDRLCGRNLGKVAVTAIPPFANPDYRTKRDALDSTVTVLSGELAVVDHLVSEERFATGGLLIVEGAQFGDYFTAEVVDTDGKIPELYRASLCENWPLVASYIKKEYMRISGASVSCHEIDAYPLSAKITAGLYIRVSYKAVAAGSDRRIAINYYMSKKL